MEDFRIRIIIQPDPHHWLNIWRYRYAMGHFSRAIYHAHVKFFFRASGSPQYVVLPDALPRYLKSFSCLASHQFFKWYLKFQRVINCHVFQRTLYLCRNFILVDQPIRSQVAVFATEIQTTLSPRDLNQFNFSLVKFTDWFLWETFCQHFSGKARNLASHWLAQIILPNEMPAKIQSAVYSQPPPILPGSTFLTPGGQSSPHPGCEVWTSTLPDGQPP